MIDEEKGPRRRVVAEIKVGADSWEDLRHELVHLATEIARHGNLSKWSVSGGYSCGHVITTSEDESVTHDSWAEANEAYVQTLKADPAGRAALANGDEG